jgi:hypothetical protein
VRATVTSAEGSIAASVGTTCALTVEQRDRLDGTFWCNTQIVCAGQLLYGGPDAGYFPCVFHSTPRRDVVGADDQTHSEDGDAAMRLDTIAGSLEIWDDSTGPFGVFRVRARVDSVE